jgi:hypothetical protein
MSQLVGGGAQPEFVWGAEPLGADHNQVGRHSHGLFQDHFRRPSLADQDFDRQNVGAQAIGHLRGEGFGDDPFLLAQVRQRFVYHPLRLRAKAHRGEMSAHHGQHTHGRPGRPCNAGYQGCFCV